MSDTKTTKISIGTRKLAPVEFANVVAGNDVVLAVDPAPLKALEDSKRDFFKGDINAHLADAPADAPAMSTEEARAVVFYRAQSFLQNRAGVRPEVVLALIDMLNTGAVPTLPALGGAAGAVVTDKMVMTALAKAVSAHAFATEAAPEPTAYKLNNNEIKRFTMGVPATQALVMLASLKLNAVVRVAEAAAGLSLEAAAAFAEPFSVVYYDNARAYPAAMEAAATFRWLIDGSTATNKPSVPKAQHEADPPCFTSLPLLSGGLREATAQLHSLARVELASAEAPSTASERLMDPAFTAQYADRVAAAFTAAARPVIAAAEARIASFIAALPKEEALAPAAAAVFTTPAKPLAPVAPAAFGTCVEALAVAAQLQETVVREAAAALLVLRVRDTVAKSKAEDVAVKKREATLKRIEQFEQDTAAAEAAGKPLPDPKRKPPAPAALDVSKLKGLSLGAGTSLLFDFALEALDAKTVSGPIPAAATDAAAAQAWLAAVSALLSPLNESAMASVTDFTTARNQTKVAKLPKGTRDANPRMMAIRERAFATITSVFQKHGAVAIDTPVFERKDTLTGKYGEDSKLIYDLAAQGGEMLSLRYDLTVPFARYVANNNVRNIRRYHIAKVYRRDQPNMARGRFREFFQCDFDIAGDFPAMVPDADAVTVMGEILSALELGPFTIKLNHRKLLDAIMAVAGVPADKFRAICSAVDKLDKEPWAVVEAEMVQQKGLPLDVARRLAKYVDTPLLRGAPFEVLARLEADAELAAHPQAAAAFVDLRLLFEYLDAMRGLQHVSLDMSLARGLDYYTGVIYEAVLTVKDEKTGAMVAGPLGSVAAGGRYDTLVGMFCNTQVPAVGMSIGIERIMSYLETKAPAVKANKTLVLVASTEPQMLKTRMATVAALWEAGIAAEFLYDANPNAKKQMEHALAEHIPIVAWVSSKNPESVNVRTLAMTMDDANVEQAREGQEEVPKAALIEYLKAKIALLPAVITLTNN